jgi:hypothetical protein
VSNVREVGAKMSKSSRSDAATVPGAAPLASLRTGAGEQTWESCRARPAPHMHRPRRSALSGCQVSMQPIIVGRAQTVATQDGTHIVTPEADSATALN